MIGYSEEIKNKMEKSSIIDFFQDTTIFITGGSGFLGIALLEKLLRRCHGIKTIYVLLRQKRGQNVDQRYNELINDQVFDRIRNQNSDVLKKLIPVPGDMSLQQIGLSENFTNILKNEVNIVFHIASVIKFNDKISTAANLNTIGTQKILDLCLSMKNLKSFVYASTAYSNFPRKTIYEEVYPTTPLSKDSFLTLVKNLPNELLNQIEDILIGSHVNTYILTKAMAESVISDYNSKIPVCIVRPSAVTGAIDEPYPGWVKGVHGVTSVVIQIGYERLCSMVGDENCGLDLIPIDTVVNTLIAAAWANTFRRSSASVQVYNCTSGQCNPFQLKEMVDLTNRYRNQLGIKKIPQLRFYTNAYMHMILAYIFHFVPAYFHDVVLKLQGSNPTMLKIAKQFEQSNRVIQPFLLREVNFDTHNFMELIDLVKSNKDGEYFNCDVSKLDWDLYFKNYIFGIENYILKRKSKL